MKAKIKNRGVTSPSQFHYGSIQIEKHEYRGEDEDIKSQFHYGSIQIDETND